MQARPSTGDGCSEATAVAVAVAVVVVVVVVGYCMVCHLSFGYLLFVVRSCLL
jgi:hypothetical protein